MSLRSFGHVVSLYVCDNEASHMDGNLYVLYEDERHAARAFSRLQGSSLCGRAIQSIEYLPVIDFAKALCSDYENGCCRNRSCNYIHSIRVGRLPRRHLLSDQFKPSRNAVMEPQIKITSNFVHDMLHHFKNQRSLDWRTVGNIISQTQNILHALPSLVHVSVPAGSCITVCGDVHGQFYDLLEIFRLNGFPSENNPYLFNGDFVDRGDYSVEVILTLFAFKLMCPSAVYLNRGNHESREMNKAFGFKKEVLFKLNETFFKRFSEAFDSLPLAHVINRKVFVVHGGLCTVDVTLSEIENIDRFCEPPERGLMSELLWSDPQTTKGRRPSDRGCGILFGRDVTKRFLEENHLDLLVRSHEVKPHGFEFEHDGKLVTVFSAPDYSKGNKGAFIRFKSPRMKPEVVTFRAAREVNSC